MIIDIAGKVATKLYLPAAKEKMKSVEKQWKSVKNIPLESVKIIPGQFADCHS